MELKVTIPAELIAELQTGNPKKTDANVVRIETDEVIGEQLETILNKEFGRAVSGNYPLESLPARGTIYIKGRAPIAVLLENGLEIEGFEKSKSQLVGR